ncbi:hypothetical protein SLS53_006984 [Cytospora paraplurivora]|uniref:Uncharacterized protein n=1 Tax=Cytospora paraplurivora TaxID=2898453 RepID=A0AAN9U8X8_9PEZI
MTWTFQVGLAAESFLNILGASLFLLFPDWCLAFAISPQAGDVPTTAAILLQTYAVMILTLTYPLLACIPNSPSAFLKRKIIYETFAAGEIGLIGLLLWHSTKREQESGFAPHVLLLAAVSLVPTLAWHLAVVWLWPSLMRGTEQNLDARKRI